MLLSKENYTPSPRGWAYLPQSCRFPRSVPLGTRSNVTRQVWALGTDMHVSLWVCRFIVMASTTPVISAHRTRLRATGEHLQDVGRRHNCRLVAFFAPSCEQRLAGRAGQSRADGTSTSLRNATTFDTHLTTLGEHPRIQFATHVHVVDKYRQMVAAVPQRNRASRLAPALHKVTCITPNARTRAATNAVRHGPSTARAPDTGQGYHDQRPPMPSLYQPDNRYGQADCENP